MQVRGSAQRWGCRRVTGAWRIETRKCWPKDRSRNIMETPGRAARGAGSGLSTCGEARMSAVPSDDVFDEAAASPLHLVRGSAPGLFWYLTEPTRCALDVGEFVATRSMLRGAPSG